MAKKQNIHLFTFFISYLTKEYTNIHTSEKHDPPKPPKPGKKDFSIILHFKHLKYLNFNCSWSLLIPPTYLD